jgi:hypothetical protein
MPRELGIGQQLDHRSVEADGHGGIGLQQA